MNQQVPKRDASPEARAEMAARESAIARRANLRADSLEESNIVAVTGSPNTVTEVQFDVRENFLRIPILGTLLRVDVPVTDRSGGKEENLLVLGQVSHLETKNRWHEEESLKNFIKLRGRLPHLTEIGDFTPGTLQIIGAYRQKVGDSIEFEKTRLSVPAGSGLEITQVTAKTIVDLMKSDFGYGYIGNFYGTKDVPAPVYIRHFGDFEDKGTGEAYMGGVFGPSGSGKSVIAAELIALYASNPQMGILLLDPQSEFSANALAKGTSFDFDFHKILQTMSGNRFDPNHHIINLEQLKLEGSEMFSQILVEKDLFRIIGLGHSKDEDALENMQRFLDAQKQDRRWNPEMSWEEARVLLIPGANNQGNISFEDALATELANAYAAGGRAAKLVEFQQEFQNHRQRITAIGNETASLFRDNDDQNRPRTNLLDLLRETIHSGNIRILNLNPDRINMSSDFKLYLVDFVFRKLRQLIHIGNRGNCLIILDEAGRFIPQNPGENRLLASVCKRLTDSTKEMRKMRCGFLFITQTIAEIQKEIFRNLHFRIYGVGLGVGVDSEHIVAREGKDAFELYTTLPDPRLSKIWAFMVAGALIALGSSGRPMIIEGYDSGSLFIQNNKHVLIPAPTLKTIGRPVEAKKKG